jgi:hypothetical protein
MSSEILCAVRSGNLRLVETILHKHPAAVLTGKNINGYTPILMAILSRRHVIARWLLEHGGADVTDVTGNGASTWKILTFYYNMEKRNPRLHVRMEITGLLRTMSLQMDPPILYYMKHMGDHEHMFRQARRLRERLPLYLAVVQIRQVLDLGTSLIRPLQDIVFGYVVSTTTDEIWELEGLIQTLIECGWKTQSGPLKEGASFDMWAEKATTRTIL